jgi:hypothetical protein
MAVVAAELALREERRALSVIDARLALGRHGLRAVASLAAHAELWLPRALFELLRAARGAQKEASALVPRLYAAGLRDVSPEREEELVRGELRAWERMPEDTELASLPLHRLGERADESLLPPCSERGLRERCEQFQRGLDRLANEAGYDRPRGLPLIDCFRDALALGAALAPRGACVLTRLEPDGGRPALLDYADAWGLHAREADARGGRPGAIARQLLARAGLAPLRWDGLRLAAIHVVLAGLPVVGGPDPRLSDEEVASRFREATLFWHEV